MVQVKCLIPVIRENKIKYFAKSASTKINKNKLHAAFYVTVDSKSIWCSSDNQLSVGLISMGIPKCIVEVSHSDFHWLCLSFCCDYGLYHHRPLSNGTNNVPAVVINFLRWQGCKIHRNPEIDQYSQEDHVEDIIAEMNFHISVPDRLSLHDE